ncbi:hypothetical protein I7I51_03674 [Histoplasma capsulatum]|uniref:Uncharacterized protein n=1 Tax=Ajellomyces capsulatus TaxID=5037 RepID=A0A8A1M651_AJECA|nr:hypothetical protein I7I51_03674 [Histoplasma capsulatum]
MAAESVLKMTLVHAGQTQAETTMEIYNDYELRNESVDAQTPPPPSCAHGASTGSGDWLDRMAVGRASSILREVLGKAVSKKRYRKIQDSHIRVRGGKGLLKYPCSMGTYLTAAKQQDSGL